MYSSLIRSLAHRGIFVANCQLLGAFGWEKLRGFCLFVCWLGFFCLVWFGFFAFFFSFLFSFLKVRGFVKLLHAYLADAFPWKVSCFYTPSINCFAN